jgi:hypothetical protein
MYCQILINIVIHRFSRRCDYGVSKELDPHASKVKALPAHGPITPCHHMDAMRRTIELYSPADVLSLYDEQIEAWFPITSTLERRLPQTWSEAELDVALLCHSILLVSTAWTFISDCGGNTEEPEAFYLHTKSSLATVESLGLHTSAVHQSRLLIALYEGSHCLFLAAHVSLGVSLRAVETIDTQYTPFSVNPQRASDLSTEDVLTLGSILVLQR